MSKVIAGLVLAFAAVIVSLGLASPAQAYPDNPPSSDVSPPQVNSATPEESQAAPAASHSDLPSTGGPNALLIGGGVALVLAGGAVVVVTRRRQNT